MPFSRSSSPESMTRSPVVSSVPGPKAPASQSMGVDEGGLAVVDVGDNSDVAQVLAHGHMRLFFRLRSAGAR